MKKKILVVMSFIALSVPFLSGCSGQINYLNNEWFVTGYGSYLNGKNHLAISGLSFNKLETPNEGYQESFEIKNASLKIGDSFYISNKNNNIRINKGYNEESSSFINKNVYLYEENDKTSIDILKTGTYDISLNINKNNGEISIFNSGDTANNLEEIVPSNQTISFFENGDFHAALNEKGNQIGIAKYASFIKSEMDKTSEEDILLSDGDLWQGNYLSNFNYGAMLNEVSDYIGYEAFSLGNHEFDWGIENIYNNQGKVSFPFLGANILDYKTKEIVDFVQPFTIIERNDAKIGVIGVIGEGQWTSITSKQVENIEFANVEEIVKPISDRLRMEFGCHAVVLLNHSGTETSISSASYALTKESPISKSRYVDGIFFGHDHNPASGKIAPSTRKVPYVNSGNNGESLAHLTLSLVDGKVVSGESETISPTENYIEDNGVIEIMNKYITSEDRNKNDSVIGKTTASFSSNSSAPNLMAAAINEFVLNSGYEVDASIVNNARSYLPSGNVTYAQLSDAFPFFNNIVILEVSGSDLNYEAKNNYFYMRKIKSFDADKKYLIATYDYLAYHMGLNRDYDKFHNFKVVATFNKYPLDILVDYWANKGTLNPNDYLGAHFSL